MSALWRHAARGGTGVTFWNDPGWRTRNPLKLRALSIAGKSTVAFVFAASAHLIATWLMSTPFTMWGPTEAIAGLFTGMYYVAFAGVSTILAFAALIYGLTAILDLFALASEVVHRG